MVLPEEEVATALDEIARRIRSGELSLQEFRGTPPEAAIAALFAAFLRKKG
jgi:3-methyladenine DNA glycosylase/8-oxoguanine DNA glycosylase